MKTNKIWITALLAMAVSALPTMAQKGKFIAYTGATIITGPGKVIEKGTLLIKDGRIESVGKEVKLPWPIEIVDCKGLWIYPGFISIATEQGLKGRPSPMFKSFAALNPQDGAWKLYRK